MSETTTVAKYRQEDFKKPAANLTVLKGMGQMVQASVAEAMPGFLRNQAPALLRALYTECQKNPALLSCTPESLFGATIQAAQMGLMLGGSLGQCYLIPFKGRVTLVPGYKGYIQLVSRSKQTGVISARAVYDRDQFEVVFGTEDRIVHRPGSYPTAQDVAARKSVAFYATCKTRTGNAFVSLTRAEAEHHRDRFALSKTGPWKDHFDAMAMKTCIIRLCKSLPMSAELQTAVSLDEANDAGEPADCSFLFAGQDDGETDAEALPPADKVDALRDKLKPGARQATAEVTPDPAPKPAGKNVLVTLVEELAEAGGDDAVAAFFEKHNLTQDDLEHARGSNASRYANLLREAVAAVEGGGE